MLQPDMRAAADPAALLLLQFLEWVAVRPRGYAETMASWRTSCPRLQVWEDATEEGLARLEAGTGATLDDTLVALTAAGAAMIAAASASRA